MSKSGYCVMKWGAGRYMTVAWFKYRVQAEAEVQRIMAIGAWQGMPPIIGG